MDQESRTISESITIEAPIDSVWDALVKPEEIEQYYPAPILELSLARGSDIIYVFQATH